MKLRTIIIDDEADALDAIENILVNDCVDIEVVAKVDDPVKALEIIDNESPDFIFLDIEMPGMNGFELLENVDNIDFDVIFATAYDEYALQAIKKNALDYILKPVTIDDIQAAIKKVRINRTDKIDNKDRFRDLFKDLSTVTDNKVKIATVNGFELICVHDIIRVEASGSYTVVLMKDGEQIVTSKLIKEMEKILLDYDFFRSHRSHLINIRQVKRFITENDGEIIMVDNSRIPLSRRRRNEFIEAIDATL
jgi:two-component system LytT family response regulator